MIMKRVVKVLGLVLIAAAFMAMAVACGNKQKDYEELLKDVSKLEVAGKSVKMSGTAKGIKTTETAAENGDVEIELSNDKFSVTLYKISGKTYMKGNMTGEDGQKQDFAFAIPESSTMASAADSFDSNPQSFISLFKTEDGKAAATCSNIKYVKTENKLDVVTADVKSGEETIPATFKFNESSKKLAGLEFVYDGQQMNLEYGDMKVSADTSSFKEGSDSDIMAVFMSLMAFMAGGEE